MKPPTAIFTLQSSKKEMKRNEGRKELRKDCQKMNGAKRVQKEMKKEGNDKNSGRKGVDKIEKEEMIQRRGKEWTLVHIIRSIRSMFFTQAS